MLVRCAAMAISSFAHFTRDSLGAETQPSSSSYCGPSRMAQTTPKVGFSQYHFQTHTIPSDYRDRTRYLGQLDDKHDWRERCFWRTLKCTTTHCKWLLGIGVRGIYQIWSVNCTRTIAGTHLLNISGRGGVCSSVSRRLSLAFVWRNVHHHF